MIITLALTFLLNSSWASNYPANYTYQNVKALHLNPALFIYVSSGILSKAVIGYKKSGILHSTNPAQIWAMVTSSCLSPQPKSFKQIIKKTEVRLGAEYHQTGYMNDGISPYDFIPNGCQHNNAIVQVIFTDKKGHWDDNDGQYYQYQGTGFASTLDKKIESYQTFEGGHEINYKSWTFIIEQMRR